MPFISHIYDVVPNRIVDLYLVKMIEHNHSNPTSQRNSEEIQNLLNVFNKEYGNNDDRIMNQNHILYPVFLSYYLITIEEHKIPLLLSYQEERYETSIDHTFINLTEHTLLDIITNRILNKEKIRLSIIVDWIEKKYSNSNHQTASLVYPIFYSKQDETIFLRNIATISDNINETQLLSQLNNLNKNHIALNCRMNQWVDYMKRLCYHGKIAYGSKKDLTDWIVKKFKLKYDNQLIDLKRTSVHAILTKEKDEPTINNMIFKEHITYLSPMERKQDKEPME